VKRGDVSDESEDRAGRIASFARDWLADERETLAAFEQEIWEYAEPSWREYRSAAAYVDLLCERGWTVEAGSGGMPTAFAATWGSGEPDAGPTLATFVEYDAVPGNSQRPVPYEAPREGLHPHAAGHTDPHSVLGVGALGGALATQAAMREFDLDGRLRLYGEPAEKMVGSKPVHAARGYFDDHDAAVSYHPWTTNTTLLETHSWTFWSSVFTFEADAPEEWAPPDLIPQADRSHAQARSPGALDALCLMYTNTKYTKEAMFPSTGTWSMSEFAMVGGQKTADNLAPRIAQLQYGWRSPTLEIQRRIQEILRENAVAAARAADCTVSERIVTRTRVGLPNETMSRLAYENLAAVGPPEHGPEARSFGREIQAELGLEPAEEPFVDSVSELTPPAEYEASVRADLPDWQRRFVSDDYVEYTWHAPTARVLVGRPRLARPEPGYSYPDWAYNALGGVPAVTHPGMFTASETIAGLFVDLLTDPDALARARAEFEERTGGGVGGDDWVPPLLDAGFVPPTDLPWPEYVETERGREWWLPTPDAEAGFGDRLDDRR
jgi:aminobenzoyl-glutamate utilization protein B